MTHSSEEIAEVDPLTGEVIARLDRVTIYPAKHFVLPEERIKGAVESINEELGLSFFDYVNRFRVEEVRARLGDQRG